VGHFDGPRATRAAFSPGRTTSPPPPLLLPRGARLGCGLWPLILFGMHYSPWADMLVGLYILATRLYRSGRSRAARANGPGHLRTAGRGSGPWPAQPPVRAAAARKVWIGPAQVPGRFYGPWTGPRITGRMANFSIHSMNLLTTREVFRCRVPHLVRCSGTF
jgi:hypothetical protein